MLDTKIRPLDFKRSGLSKKDWLVLKRLSNPKKIQGFLNALSFNFEKRGETNFSVRCVLEKRKAHCFEGALLAAAAMWIGGRRPLLLDLVTIRPDFDHVVALFREGKYWGAVSKTNHAVLRYREPVYESIRELVMSYFHEYFLSDGRKTLRMFSEPFDLSRLGTDPAIGGVNWITTRKNLAGLANAIDHSKHLRILSSKQKKKLRRADEIEIRAGKISEYL